VAAEDMQHEGKLQERGAARKRGPGKGWPSSAPQAVRTALLIRPGSCRAKQYNARFSYREVMATAMSVLRIGYRM
jgi:hypothetical protein